MSDLIQLDQQLLLALNGSDSLYWDGFWMAITKVGTWVVFYLSMIYILLRSFGLRQLLTILLFMGLAILIADQVASGICKPYFHRFRPTHEPLLAGKVDIVAGYVGGKYGFMSSHAANGFAIFTFIAWVVRNRWVTLSLFLYACLTSFSRIYLGVHYPGDILCGGLWGIITGCTVYLLYFMFCKRFFPPRKFYSSAYTSSGVVKEDTGIPIFAFYLTLVCVFIAAIFIYT